MIFSLFEYEHRDGVAIRTMSLPPSSLRRLCLSRDGSTIKLKIGDGPTIARLHCSEMEQVAVAFGEVNSILLVMLNEANASLPIKITLGTITAGSISNVVVHWRNPADDETAEPRKIEVAKDAFCAAVKQLCR